MKYLGASGYKTASSCHMAAQVGFRGKLFFGFPCGCGAHLGRRREISNGG
jgi:hypothetical protein